MHFFQDVVHNEGRVHGMSPSTTIVCFIEDFYLFFAVDHYIVDFHSLVRVNPKHAIDKVSEF